MAYVTQIQFERTLAGLAVVQKRAKNLHPVWKKLRPMVATDLREHFARREGDSGTWPGRAPSTVQRILGTRRAGYYLSRKTGRHEYRKAKSAFTRRQLRQPRRIKKVVARRLDNQLGRLKYAWNWHFDPQMMAARNRVPWAGVHQAGGRVARGARVPARPFAWMSGRIVDAYRYRLLAHVMEQWN